MHGVFTGMMPHERIRVAAVERPGRFPKTFQVSVGGLGDAERNLEGARRPSWLGDGVFFCNVKTPKLGVFT